ncbi:MAG: endopeptidase La [Gammaproteobacteria bacterium]|nr:endopeptidase La [Gammaproteobacteria bacterium]
MSEFKKYSLLPLRDVVVYPEMVTTLFVGREKSIAALELANKADKLLLLAAQKDASIDEPSVEAIYPVGTISRILQMLRLPDGTVKVLVEGVSRADVKDVTDEADSFYALAAEREDTDLSEVDNEHFISSLKEQFEQYVGLSKKVPSEVLTSLSGISDVSRLIDTMAAHMSLDLVQKQNLLELNSVSERAAFLLSVIDTEVDLFQVEKRVRGRVKKQMERSQREYYLNEQMKAIQKELGGMDDAPNEVDQLEQRIQEVGMPVEAKDKVSAELNKLKMMSPMSAEASVVRGYIDWMLGVPWKKRSKVRNDLTRAAEVLDSDHYGLEEVKERILEYLAVQTRVRKLKGPVLCLVGPPGVGKTSLGESIARATNRKFVRMALGGVRDEAEIRGHRRTYIGSMPGKLIQKISKVGVKNPLFLLDEIDKMGMDHRGDPASALLEVLDPEQNSSFNDHYLEVDYDLSDVMFICTSNSMNIPGPLLDRMEVIRIPGYTEDEKMAIAKRYLLPKQMKANGLKDNEMDVDDSALLCLVRYYTREAGVRGLERQIAKLCRKVVTKRVMGDAKAKVVIDDSNVEELIGVRKFNYGIAEEENRVGMVTGLAWTSVGGELLTIESAVMRGKGGIVKTGSLGDVMQESIAAAVTVVRSRAQSLGLKADFNQHVDLHIHVPEGATPKDGPSAGIAMVTAMTSVLTNIPIRSDVAMTGEITLRGQVLPIGGLKEKLLAARRGGIKIVLIPEENVRDLKEIPDNIKDNLDIRPVASIDEVLSIALESQPVALTDEEFNSVEKSTLNENKSETSLNRH